MRHKCLYHRDAQHSGTNSGVASTQQYIGLYQHMYMLKPISFISFLLVLYFVMFRIEDVYTNMTAAYTSKTFTENNVDALNTSGKKMKLAVYITTQLNKGNLLPIIKEIIFKIKNLTTLN
ncbi:hypothetical protein ACJX0J_007062 [Zea mays]